MRNDGRGFTLIELMVVVVIIAALAAMIVPHILPASDDARIKIAQGDISRIVDVALELYKLHNDSFPTSEEGLQALIARPASARNWKGPYLKKKAKDPWKNDYRYKNPGSRSLTGPDVWSVGPDGQDGTGDDVWPEE